MYINNHFSVYLKLTQYCKTTILQVKKFKNYKNFRNDLSVGEWD